MRLVHNKNVNNNWETKMFAGKLKEILCILFGCTMEQLEDSDFKNSPLPDEFQHLSFGMIRTYRWALTHIGTDMFKEQFDPLIWINALMREYKLGEPFQTGTTPENLVWQEPDFPNWLITDVRFPEEAQAIKDKGGIVLRINRPIKPMIITHYEDYDVLSGNPEAFKISATEYPNKLLRTCPKCNGLLVFGEEYSTIIALSSALESTKPKLALSFMVLKKSK